MSTRIEALRQQATNLSTSLVAQSKAEGRVLNLQILLCISAAVNVLLGYAVIYLLR